MTLSKESGKVEQRLVKIQNSVANLSAKVDALLGDKAKDVKLPTPEAEPMMSGAQPYTVKPEHEQPVSTIEPPVVPAEGKTPAQEQAEKEEAEKTRREGREPAVDPSTIKPPVTPVPEDPNNPKTEEEKQKEAEEKSKEEVESANTSETSRRTAPPTTTTSTSTPPRPTRPAQ